MYTIVLMSNYQSLWERFSGVVSLDNRRHLPVGFQCIKGAYKTDGERLFARVCSDRMRGNSYKLKRVGLN